MAAEDAAHDRPYIIQQLLQNARSWHQHFNSPMLLGVKKRVSVVSCMDSRLMLADIFGFKLGDAEYIRNAGGRVTPDVIRSLFVAQEVPELATRLVIILHHTDCGAQAAVRHHDHLMQRMHYYMNHTMLPIRLAWNSLWYASYLIPSFIRQAATHVVMRPFRDPEASVIEDVKILRNCPTAPRDIPIYGMVYDVMTGQVKLVIESHGKGAPVEMPGTTYQPAKAHEHNERWAPKVPVDTFAGKEPTGVVDLLKGDKSYAAAAGGRDDDTRRKDQ